MAKRKSRGFYASSIVMLIVLGAFQNCSPAGFNSGSSSTSKSPGSTPTNSSPDPVTPQLGGGGSNGGFDGKIFQFKGQCTSKAETAELEIAVSKTGDVAEIRIQNCQKLPVPKGVVMSDLVFSYDRLSVAYKPLGKILELVSNSTLQPRAETTVRICALPGIIETKIVRSSAGALTAYVQKAGSASVISVDVSPTSTYGVEAYISNQVSVQNYLLKQQQPASSLFGLTISPPKILSVGASDQYSGLSCYGNADISSRIVNVLALPGVSCSNACSGLFDHAHTSNPAFSSGTCMAGETAALANSQNCSAAITSFAQAISVGQFIPATIAGTCAITNSGGVETAYYASSATSANDFASYLSTACSSTDAPDFSHVCVCGY